MKIDVTKEEIQMVLGLMDTSTVRMNMAEAAANLYKKFQEAADGKP